MTGTLFPVRRYKMMHIADGVLHAFQPHVRSDGILDMSLSDGLFELPEEARAAYTRYVADNYDTDAQLRNVATVIEVVLVLDTVTDPRAYGYKTIDDMPAQLKERVLAHQAGRDAI